MKRRKFLACAALAPIAAAIPAVASPVDRWARDRDGLVPLYTPWEGWKGQQFYVGALVSDHEQLWLVMRYEPGSNCAGAIPLPWPAEPA